MERKSSNILDALHIIKKKLGNVGYKYFNEIEYYGPDQEYYAVKTKVKNGIFRNNVMDVYDGIIVNTGNVKRCRLSYEGMNYVDIVVDRYSTPIMLPFPIHRMGSFYTWIVLKFFDEFDEEIPLADVDCDMTGICSFYEYKGGENGDFEYGPYKVRYESNVMVFIKTYDKTFSFSRFYDYVDYYFNHLQDK